VEHNFVAWQKSRQSIRIEQIALLMFDPGRSRCPEGAAQSGDLRAVVAGEDLGQPTTDEATGPGDQHGGVFQHSASLRAGRAQTLGCDFAQA
jgi:hypothetical protein